MVKSDGLKISDSMAVLALWKRPHAAFLSFLVKCEDLKIEHEMRSIS